MAYCGPPYMGGINQCCSTSICLYVPFSNSIPFVRWQYACVVVSNIFNLGQHRSLYPSYPNAISEGWAYHLAAQHLLFLLRLVCCYRWLAVWKFTRRWSLTYRTWVWMDSLSTVCMFPTSSDNLCCIISSCISPSPCRLGRLLHPILTLAATQLLFS